jgi:uncharacterized protein YaaW (UPF0174 family)
MQLIYCISCAPCDYVHYRKPESTHLKQHLPTSILHGTLNCNEVVTNISEYVGEVSLPRITQNIYINNLHTNNIKFLSCIKYVKSQITATNTSNYVVVHVH